jgi:hypothetical protein
VRPITSEETDIPLGRNWPSTINRLGWGLLVGATVASLPWLASRVDNVVLLLIGEILGWPGAIFALALGGWNARPFTVILYSSANLVLYIGVTYFLLSMRERRKRRNRESLVQLRESVVDLNP